MREELEELEKTGDFFENQQKLKDVSDQQLISYMLRPPGEPPQFQILSELNRRKRIRMDQARAEAANTPTVAQEAIAAAGMPMGGVTQMAQAMAPKTSMAENTGIAAMMPKQPTRMATGGVVKMATAGRATREIVYDGQRYITDGSGRVFEAARRGSMRRGREITDPEIISAVLATGPSVASDVGGLGGISTNLDTFNPIASQGIASVKTPDSVFTDGMFVGQNTAAERMPTSKLDSADMSSVLKMTRGVPAMRDPAVIDPTTGQPYDAIGLMRQQAEQARQANAQAAFDRSLPTPDELMVPFNNTRNLFDPQGLNQQREDRDKNLANEIAARGREDSLSTFPVRNVFQDNQPQVGDGPDVAAQFAELGATKQTIDGEDFFVLPTGMVYDSNGRLVQGGKAMQAINSAQIGGEDFSKSPLGEIPFGSYDVDAEGNVIPESYKKAELNIGDITTPDIIKQPTSNLASFLGVDEGSAPVTDVTSAMNPQYESRFGVDRTVGTTIAGDPRIAAGVVGETVKNTEKSVPEQDAPFLPSGSGDTPDELMVPFGDIKDQETAAVINSAANTLANDVGGDALGARGPEVAKAAQQGLDKRMWMRVAMYGLIASEGTAKSRADAAKAFLAMDAKDKALETKERIAIGDRESREKVAGIRSKATQANTEARIRSAALNRDFRVLESIQEELKEDIAALMPLNPKEPVSAQNKDAYNTLTKQLKDVREKIRNLGTFDLGPGSGQTEIAGSYNVTAGAS